VAWFDFSVTTVGVTAGGVRALPDTSITAVDAETGLPVVLRQGGQVVAVLRSDTDGRLEFQAEDASTVRLRMLGQDVLVESDQQKLAKVAFTDDLATVVDDKLDAMATAGTIATAAALAAVVPSNGARAVGKGQIVVDADDYPSVQAAVDAAAAAGRAATVLIRGQKNLTATLTLPSRVSLRGDGSGRLVLDGSVSAPAVRAAGTIPATGAPTAVLSADAAAGATTVTVTSATGLAVGDVLVIGDNVAPDPTQPTRLGGELVRVRALAGTTVTLGRPLRWGYTTGQTAALWKITPVSGVAVEDLEISRSTGMAGTANTSALVDLYCAGDVSVRNVRVFGNAGPGIAVQHCWDTEIVGCTVADLADDAGAGKYGYGVNIGGAVDNLVVSACTFRRLRHAVTTNGSAHHGQPTAMVFSGLVATECSGAAFDTHAWGAGILFDGCVAYSCAQNGFTIRSSLTTLTSCKAIDCLGGGYLVAETVARDVAFLGCVAIDVGSHGFHVRDDGVARVRFIGCLVDRCGTNGITVASGCNDILVQGCSLLNVGRSVSQGIGVQALPATGTGTGWAVLDNSFAATDAPAGTTGGYRQAILLAATVSGHATNNRTWNTRTNLAAYGGLDNVRQRDNVRLDVGAAVVDGTAAPTTGTWMRGDVIRNTAPAASGFIGWVCTAAGTPGTWKTFGAISA
jgi:hypothetical protein